MNHSFKHAYWTRRFEDGFLTCLAKNRFIKPANIKQIWVYLTRLINKPVYITNGFIKPTIVITVVFNLSYLK